MKVLDYWDFLGMKGAWRWPEAHFRPEAVGEFALRIKEYAGESFRDALLRPLGLLTVRLCWELGEMSHQAEKGGGESLRSEFDQKGEMPLKWSIGTPWALSDLGVSEVDQFFEHATVKGDGLLVVEAIQDEQLEVLGTALRRAFDAAWRQGAEQGNGLLGIGNRGAASELAFAWREGDDLQILQCGSPWFGPLDGLQDVKEIAVVAPVAKGLLPKVISYRDGRGRTRRAFIPGTELGGQFDLSGHIGLTEAGMTALCREMGDKAPCLRIHLGYTPGWNLVPYGLGSSLMCWSELDSEQQEEMREDTRMVRMV